LKKKILDVMDVEEKKGDMKKWELIID